ncbi:MAG: nicotinate phosphoribosyltransferase [Pseudomonadota bacterium]
MNTNLILNTDSYKTSHYLQYPPQTEYVSSYIESRGGDYPDTLFFGLQMFLKAYLSRPVSQADVDEAEQVLEAHGVPFHREGWQYILEEHKGYLPLEIQAVAEGSVVPTGNVLLQVVNTDPKCPWLTSYVETALLRAVWYATTVATRSRACREVIRQALVDTADSAEGLELKLQDFGARGTSSEESAAIGGAAHLVNFDGTDTISGILAARRYYGADMPGVSIPAAEHSTITCWGQEREAEAYANMLQQFAGAGRVLAVVSDSYDLFHAVDNIWGDTLKQHVATCGGTVVIRPDSGDPVQIVVETIQRLMMRFGYTENRKGYRVLPPHVRVIQGDGISVESIRQILNMMKLKRLSAANITFGMGGELLQRLDRDTLKFAMKASAVCVADEWRDVFKNPVTDRGKRSKRGRLALIYTEAGYSTIRETDLAGRANQLRTVFRNGELLVDENFQEVRERARRASVGAECAAEVVPKRSMV